MNAARRWWAATLVMIVISIATTAAATQIDPEELIDLELEQAPLVETLRSFASISGRRLDVAPEIAGSVTLALERTPWRQVLDHICLHHQLNCELLSGKPPVLRVRSTRHAEGAAGRAGYAEAIDISLKGADLRQTLQSFGMIGGIEVRVDDDVSGLLTIEIEDAPWTVVLEEACHLSGCRIEWGPTLHILSADRVAATDRRPQLDFDHEPVTQALAAIASTPIFGTLGQPELVLDGALEGTISLELGTASWLDALNAVCQTAGCRWQLTYGAPSRLSVHAKHRGLESHISLPDQPTTLAVAAGSLATSIGAEAALHPDLDPQALIRFTADEAIWSDAIEELCRQASCFWALREERLRFTPRVKVLSERPIAGADDRRANIRFFAPGASEPTEGTTRFNWASSTRTFEAGSEDRWLARLSWIPLGPDLELVVPIIIRCGAGGIESQLLDPVRLPLTEPATRRWHGAILELSQAPAEDDPPPGPPSRIDCSADVTEGLRATFRQAGAKPGSHQTTLDLETRAGTYLLVTPPGLEDSTPVAAVLALGASAKGLSLAVIRPVDSGSGFLVTHRTLPPDGELKEAIAASGDVEFELRLQSTK